MAKTYPSFILLLVILTLNCGLLRAQSSANYTATAGSTQSLTSMTGSTQLIGSNQVSQASAVTNIGFDFWFMGTRYTQFSISTNGIIRLGPVVINGTANTPALASGQQRIAALASNGEDVCATDGYWRTLAGSGKVHYKVTGTAPDRMLTVEWLNMEMEAGTNSADGTFQIRIHETAPNNMNGGRMEIVYGRMIFPVATTLCSTTNTQSSVRAGFGLSETANQFLCVKLNEHPSVTGTGISRTTAISSSFTESNSVLGISSNSDGSRKFYNFVSVAPNGQATSLSSSCLSSSSATLTWATTGTNEVGYAIYRSSDNINYAFESQVPAGTLNYTSMGLSPGTTYYYRVYAVTEGKMAALSATGQTSITTPAAGFVYSLKSGSWSDATVWSSGAVPTAADDVIIGCSSPHIVTINTTTATCKALTIQSSSTLQFNNSQTLTITGTLTNNGTFDLTGGSALLAGNLINAGSWNAATSGNFTFNGSAAQSISHTGNVTTSFSSSGSVAIADNSPAGGLVSGGTVPTAAALSACATCASMSVVVPPGTYSANALSGIQFSLTHTYDSDLDIYLVAPDNSKVWLISDDNGGSDNNYTSTLIRDGGTAITSGSAPFTGTYAPEDATTLASYAGPYNGTWKLYVIDDTGADIGTITNFAILLKESGNIKFYNMILNNTSSTGVTQSNTDVVIINNLALTDGYLYTTNAYKTIFNDNATSDLPSTASYIEGFARKIGNDAFTFPVGKGGHSAAIAITAPATTTDHFTATYYRGNPSGAGYNVLQKDATIDHISQCEYWTLDRTNGTSNVSVSLRYDNVSSCGASAPAQLLVCRWDGTQWKNHGNGSYTATMVTSSGAISSFSPFTLGSTTQSNLLPVEWLNFKVKPTGEGAVLEWQTATEKDNAYFVIERSADGKSFSEIGRVAGSLNSLSLHNYAFTDTHLSESQYVFYYRIRQVNTDGTFAYSDIRSLAKAGQPVISRVYPNPFASDFIIEYSIPEAGKVSVQLTDALGRLVYAASANAQAGSNRLEAAGMTELPHGVYLLRLVYRGTEVKTKLVK